MRSPCRKLELRDWADRLQSLLRRFKNGFWTRRQAGPCMTRRLQAQFLERVFVLHRAPRYIRASIFVAYRTYQCTGRVFEASFPAVLEQVDPAGTGSESLIDIEHADVATKSPSSSSRYSVGGDPSPSLCALDFANVYWGGQREMAAIE